MNSSTDNKAGVSVIYVGGPQPDPTPYKAASNTGAATGQPNAFSSSDGRDITSEVEALPPGQRSWWNALIRNNESAKSAVLFDQFKRVFAELTTGENGMGLTIGPINSLSVKNTDDPSVVLNKLLEFMQKCPVQDRAAQWVCLDRVDFLNAPPDYAFVVPEMKIESDIKSLDDFIKEINEKTNIDDFIAAFYRYIATQKNHLPLSVYQNLLNELKENKAFNGDSNRTFFKREFRISSMLFLSCQHAFSWHPVPY